MLQLKNLPELMLSGLCLETGGQWPLIVLQWIGPYSDLKLRAMSVAYRVSQKKRSLARRLKTWKQP